MQSIFFFNSQRERGGRRERGGKGGGRTEREIKICGGGTEKQSQRVEKDLAREERKGERQKERWRKTRSGGSDGEKELRKQTERHTLVRKAREREIQAETERDRDREREREREGERGREEREDKERGSSERERTKAEGVDGGLRRSLHCNHLQFLRH